MAEAPPPPCNEKKSVTQHNRSDKSIGQCDEVENSRCRHRRHRILQTWGGEREWRWYGNPMNY